MHALGHVADFTERAISRLQKRNAVVDVLHGHACTTHLGGEFFGHGQTCCVHGS